VRKSSFQRTLAFILSLSIVSSTTAYAAPPIEQSNTPVLPGVDMSKELMAADDFHRIYADLEKAGEGQPKSSLAPDRFLMMEQTVLPKEMPVVKTFVGHQFRTWRLNMLIKRADKYLAKIGSAAPAVVLDDVARAKAWFKDFVYLEDARGSDGSPAVDTKNAIPQIEALNDADSLSTAIFKQIQNLLTKEQRQAYSEIADANGRLKKLNEIMIRTSILNHITHGRRADTPLFMWERQARIERDRSPHRTPKSLGQLVGHELANSRRRQRRQNLAHA
jgi:hypothetical protein